MDEAEGSRDLIERGTSRDRVLQSRMPPRGIDLGAGRSIEQSQGNLRLRAPERPAEWSAGAVFHHGHAGLSVGAPDDVAAVDPWMAVRPPTRTLRRHERDGNTKRNRWFNTH